MIQQLIKTENATYVLQLAQSGLEYVCLETGARMQEQGCGEEGEMDFILSPEGGFGPVSFEEVMGAIPHYSYLKKWYSNIKIEYHKDFESLLSKYRNRL